jgi:protein-arginine kinase activator protein McsA
VPASGELLFGKIALTEKFCTQAHIDECTRLQLQLQSPHQPAPRLGDLLLEKGYLTAEQHAKILEIQQQNLDLVDPLVKKRKEAILFGKLAVKQGLVTPDEVNQCLRLQAEPAEMRSLGEILVARGFLTAIQVKEILNKQLKKIMSCPVCKLSFTVLTLSEGKRIDCPKCKGPLKEGKATDSTRTDAEFATQVMRSVQAGLPPVGTPKPAKGPTVMRQKCECVICDNVFNAALDPSGRVQCPACYTTFTPR